jgi:predicted amidohydrolase
MKPPCAPFVKPNNPAMTIPPWRATCIQMPSTLACDAATPSKAWEIISKNLGQACSVIEQALASPTPPRLVVLPEFAMQGPPHGMRSSDWIMHACCTIPGPITSPLQALASHHGIFIAGHQFESSPDWPGRYFNTCFLIGPDGSVMLRYRRVNTAAFPSPHDFLDAYQAHNTPSDVFPVVETQLGKLAMIPCGEINVPEVARVLMMQGAEVILHPTNSPNRPAQEAAKIARAAENAMFLISANVADGIGFSRDGSIKGGRSHILDFTGKTLAYEPEPIPCHSVSAMIDIEALRAARQQDNGTMNPLLRARWEMYRPFYAQASFYPPNSFREKPMEQAAETVEALAQSRANMRSSGIA